MILLSRVNITSNSLEIIVDGSSTENVLKSICNIVGEKTSRNYLTHVEDVYTVKTYQIFSPVLRAEDVVYDEP